MFTRWSGPHAPKPETTSKNFYSQHGDCSQRRLGLTQLAPSPDSTTAVSEPLFAGSFSRPPSMMSQRNPTVVLGLHQAIHFARTPASACAAWNVSSVLTKGTHGKKGETSLSGLEEERRAWGMGGEGGEARGGGRLVHAAPPCRPRHTHIFSHAAEAADINNSLLIFNCSGEMWGQSNPDTNHLSTCVSLGSVLYLLMFVISTAWRLCIVRRVSDT